MPYADWPLHHGRPCIQVILTLAANGQPSPRTLIADTGAGSRVSGFELVLDEDDCLLCGGLTGSAVALRGAVAGSFPLYDIRVQFPALGYAADLRAVGVPAAPAGFDGIACFGFLNSFHYGNFGDRNRFGLEL